MEIASKAKILVVDDEHTIANTLSWLLNSEGFETRAAYSGEEAVEVAQSFFPDALICDVMMSGISGMEAAARICARFPSCRVLVISGHVSVTDLEDSDVAKEHQFDFLSKPVHPRILLDRLRTILSLSPDPV
jgi:DNA-binding response OmpR family regulator